MSSVLINTVDDPEQDRVYTDVAGMITNENNPEIFGPELLPGETIVREFRAFQVDQGRSGNMLKVLYILTCGIYWIWINLCGCCRFFGIGNDRTRVCITDKGRIMLWHNGCNGMKKGATIGFDSHTNMEWYHLDDLNSFQMLVRRENKCGPCSMCGVYSHVVMRLFFGETYPTTRLLNGMGLTDTGAIQGLYKPEWTRSDFLIGALKGNESAGGDTPFDIAGEVFGILSNLGAIVGEGCYHFGTCGVFYYPGAAIASTFGGRGQFALDVESYSTEEWKDGYHKEQGKAWAELISLAKFVTNAKKTNAPLAKMEPNPHCFIVEHSQDMDEAADSKLVVNNKVSIDAAKFPFGENEKVVDAIVIQPRISWWECIFVPTITCKRKYKTDSAAILTTHRAFSVSEYRSLDGNYDFSMSCYFMGELKGGMMITDPKGELGYSTDVETTYGALRIQPIMSEKWPWTPKVPEKMKQRMYAFMHTIERACATEQAIPAPAKGSLPNSEDVESVAERVNLWDGEEICSVIRSDNLYNIQPFLSNPCVICLTMGDVPSATELVKFFTCGCRPWKLDQFLVLTTHRMLSLQEVNNTCKMEMCQGEAKLMLWAPLQEIEAMRMMARFSMPVANCCQRILKDMCKCCNKDTATLDVALGREGGYGPAPFKIGRVAARPQQGLLEGRPDLKHFRAALAYYHSTREINEDHLEIEVTNESYGQTPFPDNLKDDPAVKNPMIGGGGVQSALIGVGTKGS
eukprot:gb/GECG01013959.1/.p1 GENE.gb/GECG01013959.1/~~gb/GECG01013959.1/.p1  ORF type:complete len:743 (+),score=69.98 gb/GECG01013959.1/:1-2229(+)